MEAVAPDRRLAGRYILEHPIASGGMASVWRARDEVLARPVAVKILRADLVADPEFFERFQREAVAAAALTHPGIISVYDTGIDAGVCYIVLELADGLSLRELLAKEGALEPVRAVEIGLQVLSALAAAHEAGVIHRDVKPGNIMVAQDGRVKVTDFGIAKAAFHGSDLTSTGAVLGTVRYLSPEQVEGVEVDARTDLYSMGIVLYEALTGRPPFRAETDIATAMMRLTVDPPHPRDIRASIPRSLDSAVVRALARRPEARFPSAESMRTALERAVRAERTLPRGVPPVRIQAPPTPRSTFRSWMLAPLLLVLLAAAVIAGGLALGRLEIGGPLGVRPAPEGSAGSIAEPAATPVPIGSVLDVDPEGNDRTENHGQVEAAIDGNPDTAWSTEHYDSANFGGLKQGVGLWLAFDGRTTVSRVSISSPLSGWAFQLFGGTHPDPAGRALQSGTGASTFTANASGTTTVRLRPSTTSGILIWITRLVPDGARFAASIGDVSVAGAPG